MSEITTTDADTGAFAMPVWVWIGLVALVLAVYFSGLTVPLMGPDEPRYAQVAREMYERGDWLTPTLAGHPWFEKPPLLYWFEVASYRVFGVNEFAARFGPAVCGLLLVGALWMFARAERRASAGLLALMTAATVGIIAFSHTAGFDIVLTTTMTCALVCFWTAETSGTQRVRPLVGFYIFTTLAVLAKGLVGFFPLAIVGLFYAVSRRMPRRQIIFSLAWGLPLLLVIAVPWHAAMYLRHGNEFVDIYFIQHHFDRFTTNRYLHPQPFYFFWWVLPLLALPWTPLAIARIVDTLRKRLVASPLVLFSSCWVVLPLVFFSFSGSKLPGYILPAVPPVVILAWMWLRERRSGKWAITVAAVSLSVAAAALVVIVGYLPSYAARDSVKELIATADSRGYSAARVLTLFMVSHNAEFYAGGRLFHDAEGKQVMLEGGQGVLDEINKEGRPVLVLVPAEHTRELTDYSKIDAAVLATNGRIAIVAAAAK